MMRKLIMAAALTAAVGAASAQTTWMIGDNDGYGAGIPDNANHAFDAIFANYDGRSAAEAAATDGAQFTDTYSTTHPGYSPHGTLTTATFTFAGIGTGWTQGAMWFDMADFQALVHGAAVVRYNGIVQNWAFNDGVYVTTVRWFNLSQPVLDSINSSGALVVEIERGGSGDFYGFDYAMLSNVAAVPEPATYALLLLGLAGLAALKRH